MAAWLKEPESLLATAEPNESDILYFAGFYDGEGSACLQKSGGCVVQIPQKDPEILYRGRALWGGTIRVNGRGIAVWVMSGDRARLFLIAIYPHLSTRRKAQIEAANGLTLTGKTSLKISGMTPDRAIARATMTERQRHSETVLKWQRSNPERVREIALRSREKNRERINARQRERRAAQRAMKSCTAQSQVPERSQLVN